MHKLVLLIRNSLHKSRGQMASLLIIVILSGLMMNIGALTLFDFGVFFDEKIEQTHTPHLSFLIQKDRYRPADEGFLRMDTHVTETRTEEVLFLTNGSFAYGDGHLSLGMVFQNMDVYREMAPISLIGDADLTLKNGIYAPYLLHAGSGYEVGDVFSVESDHRQYDFQIAGFVEDVMFGGMNTGMIGFFVPDALYQRLRAAGSATPAVYLTAKLDDISFSEEVMNGYVAAIDDSSGLMWAMSALIAKYARMIVPNIVSMVIAAFSVIITVIALVVIRFRINDSIRDDIKDIGVLKSLGYVTSQINASILLLFLCITAVGSVLGIGLSYLLVPLISGAFSAQTGLIWVQGFSPQTSILCLLVMLSTVALNASYCLRRVKDLHPIAAIRGDGDARGFKRNYFRLDESAWGLQFSLACKQIMQNLGQNVMIALITAAVTFASAFGLIFYNNMAVDSDSFIMTIAGELCSAAVAPISNQYTARMVSEINGMPEVRKAIAFDDITTFVSDEPIMTSVTEDFDDLDGQMLYEGNYPRSAGEVAIGGNLAASEGKTIGDTIEIRGWKDKAEYRISGFIQSGNNMGRTLAMTAEGVKRILPEYLP
ncbi:MAG: ABC transporter permease, partial [Clostridiales bacterium]|nr:ABC transporter permease [Clostridiales bacterium]